MADLPSMIKGMELGVAEVSRSDDAIGNQMRVTQQIIGGDSTFYIDGASVPVDRFTRLLIRSLIVVIGDKSWAVLNAKPFCHRWLYRRVSRQPLQFTYQINRGEGWETVSVPVAVAV